MTPIRRLIVHHAETPWMRHLRWAAMWLNLGLILGLLIVWAVCRHH